VVLGDPGFELVQKILASVASRRRREIFPFSFLQLDECFTLRTSWRQSFASLSKIFAKVLSGVYRREVGECREDGHTAVDADRRQLGFRRVNDLFLRGAAHVSEAALWRNVTDDSLPPRSRSRETSPRRSWEA